MPEPAVGEAGAQRRPEQAELRVPRPGRRPVEDRDCFPRLPHPEASLPITPRARMRSPVAPDRAETRHAEAENHRAAGPKRLESSRRPRALGSSGAGRTGRALSPEPGSALGLPWVCWSFRVDFLERSGGAAGWGERKPGAAAGQVREPSVPCPGTAVICAPHRTQLWCSPPSLPRPSLRGRVYSPPPARGWSFQEPPRLSPHRPIQQESGLNRQVFRPINRQETEAGGLVFILLICPHLRPPHLPPALPRREPRLMGRVQRTARLQDQD